MEGDGNRSKVRRSDVNLCHLCYKQFQEMSVSQFGFVTAHVLKGNQPTNLCFLGCRLLYILCFLQMAGLVRSAQHPCHSHREPRCCNSSCHLQVTLQFLLPSPSPHGVLITRTTRCHIGKVNPVSAASGHTH